MAHLFIIFAGQSWTHTLEASNTIGSSERADIRLESPELEAVEAQIERTGSRYRLRDVTGRGLVRVDGKPVRQHVLKAGDKIELGGSFLVFTPAETGQVHLVPEVAPRAPAEAESAPAKEPEESAYELVDEQAPGGKAELAPCIYCGHQIRKGVSRCAYCGELLGEEARRKAREEAGPWSLLSDRAMATRGVNLEVMIRWVREGKIDRNSTVRGPSTRFEWRYAAEALVLSKYLGVCPYCQAQVSESDEFCPACRGDLEGKGRLAPELEARAKEEVRKRKSKKWTVVLVVLLFLAIVGAFFVTPVWRWVLPGAQESWMEQKLEAMTVGFKSLVGPARFSQEKALAEKASQEESKGNFRAAIAIYEELIATYPDTGFAQELSARLEKAEGWRSVKTRVNVADNYRRNRMYAQALRIYREQRGANPDYPLISELEQRISETERELSSGGSL